MKSLRARFLSHVQKEKDCWQWIGCKLPKGYGKIGISGVTMYAHRVSYMIFRGEIPEGLQIDHLCRNVSCVNPKHLEAVTCRTNLLRGNTVTAERASRTHCLKGHPLFGDNVHWISPTMRRCKQCERIRQATPEEKLKSHNRYLRRMVARKASS